MEYLTVEQIRDIDCKATKVYGIPSIVLMENAGRTIAEETLILFESTIARPHANITPSISIICGSGNNAGDGFVAAKYLYNWGSNVKVYLLKNYSDYKDNALINLAIINKMKISINTILVKTEIKNNIEKSDIIIDAIFGTGLKGKIKGIHKDIIELINNSNKTIIAVDIPSGLDGNIGIPMDISVKADMTVSMGYLKKGFRNPESKKFTGKVIVADIGYPLDILR